MYQVQKQKGITLIALVITIVVLVILSAVAIYLALGNNGILNKAEQAKNETIKQTATEKMNLKITNMQIEKYAQEQRMPTLQEFADGLCEDNEIQYVQLQSKKVGSLSKIEVGEAESIFIKLKEYPYEFEINTSLQLASIDGIQVATNDTVTIPKEEYDKLKNANSYSTDEKKIGTWIDGKIIYQKTIPINQSMPNSSTAMSVEIDFIPVETLINIDCLYKAHMDGNKGVFCVASARGEIIYNNRYTEGKAEIQIIQTQTLGNTGYAIACIMQYTKTTDTATNN